MSYSVKAQHGTTQAQHNAATDLAGIAFRSLTGATRRARKLCRDYDASAEIYDTAGWLVLRVDAGGHRAP